MSDNAPPSIDPADEDNMVGMLRTAFKKFLQNTDDMLPARVIAFNGDRNAPRVTVEPLVKILTTAGQAVARAQIASVPVLQCGAGGFLLSFPIKPGDLGWIKANDRDISLFLQSYNPGTPNTLRLHSFEDGVFIPDCMRDYTIDGEDDGAAVLQSVDGTVKVVLTDEKLVLAAPDCKMTMEAGTVEIDAPAGVTINAADAIMTGNLTVTGEVTANGIPLSTHRHTGVVAGGDTSGGPVP
jgi:hypothetical protein